MRYTRCVVATFKLLVQALMPLRGYLFLVCNQRFERTFCGSATECLFAI